MRREIEPEIARLHLGNALLQLLRLGVRDPLHFDFVERPEQSALLAAYQTLEDIGAVEQTGTLTADGLLLSDLPFDPRISKMVLHCHKENLGYEGFYYLLLNFV